MPDEGDSGSGGSSDDDPLLRAIARAPSRPLDGDDEMDPVRVAHFTISERLGSGGMGVVFRAHDESLRREVALKLLPIVSARDPERRQRFLREARVAASLVHANVAVVHQVGESDGRVYIAMELVDGVTLRKPLEKGALPLTLLRGLALQMAQGLAAAHAKGIVHRDLKPENVMVTSAGTVKLLDFGLAKSGWVSDSDSALGNADTEAQITREGDVLGSSAYMSPEQALGMGVDARSDVFSFGIVLYEMLTGRRPFAGRTMGEVRSAIARDAPLPPDASADTGIATIAMRCLEKRTEARYEDASGIVRALLALPVVSENAATRATRTRSWRPGLVGALAVAVSIVAVAIVAMRIHPETPPSPALSATADAAPARGVAMTEHLAPKTSIPQAATAYASALQSWRDGSMAVGGNLFARAAELDPSMAAAHLRSALYTFEAPAMHGREELAAATRLRAQLDERDLALLRVAEATLAEPRDPSEALRRAREAVKRFPRDSEVCLVAGIMSVTADDPSGARVLFAEALALDPELAAALAEEGLTWESAGEQDRALATFERCAALSPSAATCVRNRASIYELRGDCAEVERTARELTRIEPTGPRAYEMLGRALAGRGAPSESVREALDKMVSLGGEAQPFAYGPLVEQLWLALLAGDLQAAERALRDMDAAAAADTSEGVHANIAAALLEIANERGDDAEEARILGTFERRSEAWSPDYPGAMRLPVLYAKHRAKRMSDADFVAARDRLMKEQMKIAPDVPWWVAFYSPFWFGVPRPEELSEFASQFAARPPPPIFGLDASLVGQPLLRGGNVDAALPWLERGAAACRIMSGADDPPNAITIDFFRAQLYVGEAREAKGNIAGACAAYRVVTDRWAKAKPRSITLESATRRAKSLHCPR